MSVIDEFLSNNRNYAKNFTNGSLPMPPAKKLALVVCMDSRMDTFGMLGMDLGQAHIIRNAGGVVTDDVIRSLIISQRLQNTRAVMLVHHTDCGMLTFTDAEMKQRLKDETGVTLPFAMEAFTDLDENVRDSIARIKNNPFIPNREEVRGFVYDVKTGKLREVS